MKFLRITLLTFFGASLLAPLSVSGTQTENYGLQVLPAPGEVTIDGKTDDWDLSAGLFACDDVENQRDDYATWLHAMYDENNLYVLARFTDLTPLNNPGQTIADAGFQGDCLQFRIITNPGTAKERVSHWTCWRGSDGKDIMNVQYGKGFNEGTIRDAKNAGAQQAFSINGDGKGYVQEIAIPWKLLTHDGLSLPPGSDMRMTFEPNFTVAGNTRFSIKDLFQKDIRPDRSFTFMAPNCWGTATLEVASSPTNPKPVRLSDGRLFPVTMESGVPVINWDGLVKTTELPGFKSIVFSTPQDGYVSLNIKSADGSVVRQLLNGIFYTKGQHEVKWDGLTTPNFHTPGQPVPAGQYTWSILFNTGIGLKLRGWAANGGSKPWDEGPTSNWGGDQGNPCATAADDSQVYLGWSMAEAASALVACDLSGNVLWKNKRSGISGVKALAVDDGVVYVLGGEAGDYSDGGAIYKLNSKDGSYLPWGNGSDSDLVIKTLWGNRADAPVKADGIAVANGRLYLSFNSIGNILVLDAKTEQVVNSFNVPSPRAICYGADGNLYVLSGGKSVLRVDANGTAQVVVPNLTNAAALALDKNGTIYVGTGDPDNQVKMFGSDGKSRGTLGLLGGRPLIGKWTANGFRSISSLSISSDDKLWVAENDACPKRISVWDATNGTLVKEFFGAAPYGATGGAIDPLDPDVMVGLGCEWRLDPRTGVAACTAVIDRNSLSARFGVGSNGHLYLATTGNWTQTQAPVSIYERTGEAEYKLRAKFTYDGDGNNSITHYWADDNDDQQVQPSEVTSVQGIISCNSWYMSIGPDMTIYSGYDQYKVTGFTTANAPIYDLSHPVRMPHANEHGGMGASNGLGSADDSMVLYNGEYQADRSTFNAYNIDSGKLLWSYPNNFVGVHGSHNAGPPEPGLIRGAYDFVGSAKLPAPIGNIWVIATNVGEWHILTEDGFYLTKLFQGNPLKVRWPATAEPGADMTDAPPGLGGEDFGGAIAYGTVGKLYIQAGKTGFWNLEVTGLDSVKALAGGTIDISNEELAQEGGMQAGEMQAAVGPRVMEVREGATNFTGSLEMISEREPDFLSEDPEASVRAAMRWDDKNLYLGWDVDDDTPWKNSAKTPEDMYDYGDTVDFQLGTDRNANKNRSESTNGDLRISIGNFKGDPTAILYRKVSDTKKQKVFSSGIVHAYAMDYVAILHEAKISVKMRDGGYCVEASIPLTSIDFNPAVGESFYGDLGATHGDSSNTRTRLRTFWSNQDTGLVDDAVFELKLEPKNWGEFHFVQ